MTTAARAGDRPRLWASARARAEAVPTWALLTALVAVSTFARFLVAIRNPAPWIFNDELNYSDLARSLGRTGHFAIRGTPGLHGFGPVYPALIAPAYAIFDSVPHAYDAVRGINSLLMSLASVPAYFLARRLVGRWWALLAAVLTVAIPSMTYTAAVMTENAFFPLVMASALAMVLALERPTLARQLLLFVPILLAFETRAQAAIFGPALVTTLFLLALVEMASVPRAQWTATLLASIRRYAVIWCVLIIGTLLAVLYEVARGRPLNSLLGSYGGVTQFRYAVGPIARWFFFHLGELDLSLGVLPFAAFLLLVFMGLRPRELDRELRLFAAVGASLVFWFTFTAAAYASNPLGYRIEERYLFHIAPLLLIAFAVWLGRGMPRPWPMAAVAAVAAAALPGTVPWPSLLDSNAVNGAFATVPLIRLTQRGLQVNTIAEVVALGALVGAAIFVLLHRRAAAVAVFVVLAYFVAVDRNVTNATRDASIGSLGSGIRGVHRDWVDRAVGGNSDVAILFYAADQVPFWQNEFFNAAIDRVYNLTPGPYDGLPQTLITTQPRTGDVAGPDGKPVRTRYVFTNQAIVPAGQKVASDEQIGTAVYRTTSPLRIVAKIDGIYPDRWSGASAGYTRYACRPGTLTVTLLSDRDLHPTVQTIVAVGPDQRELGRLSYRPKLAARTLTVPLRPQQGVCAVTFNVTPTAVPLQVTGQPDTRALGIRFLRFDYRRS
jgi:Dolichyl-phosphate-mannose-protein mannosyltransferase